MAAMASFTTDYLLLLIGLGLLYFPRQWLRGGKKRTLKSEKHSKNADKNDFDPSRRREMGDPAVVFRDEFSKLRNYIDLLRGAVGSVVIVGSEYTASCFSLSAGSSAETGRLLIFLKGAIILGSMFVQLFRYERRLTLFAPIFFVGGLTFGLCGFMAAALAFVLIWALNLGLPGPAAFLGVYSVLIVPFGILFDGPNNLFVIVGFLALFLPVLISLLWKRPLMLFNRRG
jgi:hypothetical protein